MGQTGEPTRTSPISVASKFAWRIENDGIAVLGFHIKGRSASQEDCDLLKFAKVRTSLFRDLMVVVRSENGWARLAKGVAGKQGHELYNAALRHRHRSGALSRTRKVFKGEELDLIWATASDPLHRTTRRLGPEYHTIMVQARMSDVVHTNRTPLRLGGEPYRTWDFLDRRGDPLRPTKGRGALQEIPCERVGTAWWCAMVQDPATAWLTTSRNAGPA